MKTFSWVETVVATKPVHGPKNGDESWVKIHQARSFQLWVCRRDLKETVVDEAKEAFGKALEQVIRIGSYPAVLYPKVNTSGFNVE